MQTEQCLARRLYILGGPRCHLCPTFDERRWVAQPAAAQRPSLHLAHILAGRRGVAQLGANLAPCLTQQHEIAVAGLDLVEQTPRPPVASSDTPRLPQRLPQQHQPRLSYTLKALADCGTVLQGRV